MYVEWMYMGMVKVVMNGINGGKGENLILLLLLKTDMSFETWKY
jgi:hypothetical protein